VYLGGVTEPPDPACRPVPSDRHCLALLAIATLTADCGESTGGISSTATVLFWSPSRWRVLQNLPSPNRKSQSKTIKVDLAGSLKSQFQIRTLPPRDTAWHDGGRRSDWGRAISPRGHLLASVAPTSGSFAWCKLGQRVSTSLSTFTTASWRRRSTRTIRITSSAGVGDASDWRVSSSSWLAANTYTKEQFVKPEVEAAIEKHCAMIAVNLDHSWRVNAKLTPSFMRNIGAIFVPFSPRIIQYALATCEANPDNDYTFTEAIYQSEGYRLFGDKAVFRKC